MRLSELNKGDYFRFIGGQVALQMANSNKVTEYHTTNHIEFEVLKRNDMSVKVKPTDRQIEYIFKFKGLNKDSRQGADCLIEIISLNIKEPNITVKINTNEESY